VLCVFFFLPVFLSLCLSVSLSLSLSLSVLPCLLVSSFCLTFLTREHARQALLQFDNDEAQAIIWLSAETELQAEAIRRKENEERAALKLKQALRRQASNASSSDDGRPAPIAVPRVPSTPDPVLLRDPSKLYYGDKISLRAASRSYLISKPDHFSLLANVSELSDMTCFVVENPDDAPDRSVVNGRSRIALRCSDDCYIGVEANGAVFSKRKNLDPFMSWRIHPTGQEEPEDPIKSKAKVMIESVLHKFLETRRDGMECFARSRDPNAYYTAWALNVEEQGSIQKPPSNEVGDVYDYKGDTPLTPSMSFEIHGRPTGKQLWNNLRNTFRLRALRMQREAIEQLKEDIERKRKELQLQNSDERLCVICLDEEPNTVCV
jgi:hypothetical protein